MDGPDPSASITAIHQNPSGFSTKIQHMYPIVPIGIHRNPTRGSNRNLQNAPLGSPKIHHWGQPGSTNGIHKDPPLISISLVHNLDTPGFTTWIHHVHRPGSTACIHQFPTYGPTNSQQDPTHGSTIINHWNPPGSIT